MTKFTRRLQRIGNSTLVSLPKEWVDAHNLQKGSRVELEDLGNSSLSVSVLEGDGGETARTMSHLVISYPLPAEENIVADITGAYLLGYDVIRIESSGDSGMIPIGDRESVRNSMRRLVGMEIIEEDASHMEVQFLLDAATLSPAKILKRMSSIAMGMCEDVTRGLISQDKSNLQTIRNRDIEVNRQYFLLVRLIRSTLADRRLAGAFNLGSIDILDYRVAANLLENAGDSVVELARLVMDSDLSAEHSQMIFEAVQDLGRVASAAIDAFTAPDRRLAIESISFHQRLEDRLARLRTMPPHAAEGADAHSIANTAATTPNTATDAAAAATKDARATAAGVDSDSSSNSSSSKGEAQLPVDFIDVIHMYEKIARSWADVADLVKPIYNKR